MSTPLTIHNAQVATATVAIRTLTITGKQVTLAVFRQLLEEQPPTGMPLTAFWGRVNYCPDKKCLVDSQDGWGRDRKVEAPHLHLVWQKDSELRRVTIHRPRRPSDYAYDYERAWNSFQRLSSWYAALESLPQLFIAV